MLFKRNLPRSTYHTIIIIVRYIDIKLLRKYNDELDKTDVDTHAMMVILAIWMPPMNK